jgi:DNA-binding response OmpR family regulator
MSAQNIPSVTSTPALRIALIEDDPPTRAQLKAWVLAAKPGLIVDEWDNRDDAQAAVEREDYAAVILDIELGRERNAGVAIINTINQSRKTPVLVVSAMPAAVYRGIFKALDAWDYLQKTSFDEQEFVETFLELLRASRQHRSLQEPTKVAAALSLDPLHQQDAMWKGRRINLPLTAQRILSKLHEKQGQVVSYEDLYLVIKSGRNRDNVRKHVATIREAIREIEPEFEGVENVPMRGFMLRLN